VNQTADPANASSVPVRSPLWLAVWLAAVTVGILGFLQVGMAALSH
jgi:hypothetical protein